MKKPLGLTLVILLLVAFVAPPVDAGWGRGGHGRWEGGFRQEYRGSGGCPACGFLGGFILGGVLAARAFGPPPVYAVPPPIRHTQPGYWTQVPVASSGEYTTYRNVWVARGMRASFAFVAPSVLPRPVATTPGWAAGDEGPNRGNMPERRWVGRPLQAGGGR